MSMKQIADWALNTATQRGASYADIRIVDDIRGFGLARSFLPQSNGFRLIGMQFKPKAFDIENNPRDILGHPGDRRKFMEDALNANRGDSRTGQ